MKPSGTFCSPGSSPDPPPREPAWHSALDPGEPGSWGDTGDERKILWTDGQQGNREVVQAQGQLPQVSAGNVPTSHQTK